MTARRLTLDDAEEIVRNRAEILWNRGAALTYQRSAQDQRESRRLLRQSDTCDRIANRLLMIAGRGDEVTGDQR